MEKIALLPGGFKPPHAGHYNMAKWLANNTDAEKVVIKIGSKVRDGISREMSLQLWTLYIQTDKDPLSTKISAQSSESPSPVRDVYDFIEQEAPKGSTVYLGMGEKDINDARFKNIGKFADPKKITFKTVLVPPQAGGISGTEMRGFIAKGDKVSFYNSLPNHLSAEQKGEAWNIVYSATPLQKRPIDPRAVSQLLEEDLYNPEDKVNDYMRSSEFKAGYSKKDDIPPGYKYRRGGMYNAASGQGGAGTMYETRGGESELHIYDFDETIARVETSIPYVVKSPKGEIIEKGKTTSVDFEKKQKELEKDYDKGIIINFDFKAFEKQIGSAIVNEPVYNKLLNSLEDPNIKTTVLTARSIGHPVTRYLKSVGLDAYVVPLGMQVDGKVTGQDKANWIDKRIKKTTKRVYFVDDSEDNRAAVNFLKDKYPNILFDIENPPKIKDKEVDEMIGMMSEPEKKKHAKNLKRLSKDLKKQGDQYMEVPSYLKGTLRRKMYEKDLLNKESIVKDNIVCDNCGWSWKIKDGGDDLFICHKCDHNNTPLDENYGGYDLLAQFKNKIKSDHGPQQYRNLQLMLSQNKDKEVKKYLKTKGYMNETKLFSKEWWSNQLNEIITEGGAAGHMAHPFNLSNVNSGKDLLNIFEKSADSLQNNPGAVKIDGVNSSIRLVDLEGKKQFVMDRGSKKELDVKGITKDDLLKRFGGGHGMVKVGGEVLDLFNSALPNIKNDLEKLGAYNDPNILFNMEYVSGKTNVQDYSSNFIAIHGLNKIESKEVQGARKMLTKRISSEISYDKLALQSLVNNLAPIAKKKGYEIYGSVPTKMKKKPNFSSALSKNYTVNAGEESKTQSLGQWLNELNDIPEEEFIFMNIGYKPNSSTVNNKKVGAVSKQVYLAILNKENVDGLFDNAEDRKKAIQGFVTYLATEKLGDEVLKVLDSPMSSVENHEGVVIRDKNISDVPFKITGKFILGGLATSFR